MDEIQSLMQGFAVALTLKNIAFMFVGVLLGVIIGVLRLGGANGVAILAAHFLDGAGAGRHDHRHHPAVEHLLGRAVRRRDHIDSVQYSGEPWWWRPLSTATLWRSRAAQERR